MNYALDDIKKRQLDDEIKKKDIELFEYYKNIKKKTSTNRYLNDVLEEYKKYYVKMLEEKKMQEKALENILNYLKNIKEIENQTKTQILEDKIEKKNLLDEIKKVKNEIILLTKELVD